MGIMFAAAVLILLGLGFMDFLEQAEEAGMGPFVLLAICVLAGICSGLTGC